MTDEFEGLFDCLDGSITPGEMRGKPLCLEHVEALFGMIRIEPYWLGPVNPEEIAALCDPEFEAKMALETKEILARLRDSPCDEYDYKEEGW